MKTGKTDTIVSSSNQRNFSLSGVLRDIYNDPATFASRVKKNVQWGLGECIPFTRRSISSCCCCGDSRKENRIKCGLNTWTIFMALPLPMIGIGMLYSYNEIPDPLPLMICMALIITYCSAVIMMIRHYAWAESIKS